MYPFLWYFLEISQVVPLRCLCQSLDKAELTLVSIWGWGSMPLQCLVQQLPWSWNSSQYSGFAWIFFTLFISIDTLLHLQRFLRTCGPQASLGIYEEVGVTERRVFFSDFKRVTFPKVLVFSLVKVHQDLVTPSCLPGLLGIPWFLCHYGSEEALNGNIMMLNNHFMLTEHWSCEMPRETLSVLLLFGLTGKLEG